VVKLFLSLISLVLPAFAVSQSGGFGHFSAGWTGSGFGHLDENLSAPALMGPVNLSRTGVFIGGGGFGLAGKHLLLGGKGFAADFGSIRTERGTAKASQGWGFFNFGYLHELPGEIWSYAFCGLGGGGAGVQLSNSSGHTWDFGEFEIRDGQSASIGTGGMGIDFGLGVQKFFPDSRGGFKVGLELGASLGMTSERWNSANIYAENLGYWNPQMLYFALCIGGGAINQNASPNAK
jgi:hypothetical protein